LPKYICLNTIKHLDNIFFGHENFSDKIFLQTTYIVSELLRSIWERPGHQLHGHHHLRVDDALRLQPRGCPAVLVMIILVMMLTNCTAVIIVVVVTNKSIIW